MSSRTNALACSAESAYVSELTETTRDSGFIRLMRAGILRQGPVLFRTRARMREVIQADGEKMGIGLRLMNTRTAKEMTMGDEGSVMLLSVKFRPRPTIRRQYVRDLLNEFEPFNQSAPACPSTS